MAKTLHYSVALCAYNGRPYIAEQLASILAQTRQPDELVVCDDGSMDGTPDIVREFARSAPFSVRFEVNAQNRGSTRNFEKAIALCQGDIIVLCDHDDTWRADKLEQIDRVMASSPPSSQPPGGLFTDAEMVDERLQPLGYRLWSCVNFNRRQQQSVNSGQALDVLLRHNVATGATMAFRAEFKDLILPMPETGVHDSWIALLIAAVSRLALIGEPLINYRQHAKNQIGAVNRDLSAMVAAAKRPAAEIYQDASAHYAAALDRLQTSDRFACSDATKRRIARKVAHLDARGKMPKARSLRLPVLVREALNLNYFRYSNGFLSLASDVVRPD